MNIAVKPIEVLKEELLPTVMPCINELLQIVKNDKEYEVSQTWLLRYYTAVIVYSKVSVPLTWYLECEQQS